MTKLWAKIIAWIVKVFGVGTIPPEVASNDTLIDTWGAIYRGRASWIAYTYVTASGEKTSRDRLSLKPAKIVCSEAAGLVLAETPEVKAGPLVDEVLKYEKFWDNERKNLESQCALGGRAIKIYTADGKIHIDFVRAPNFIPIAWDNAQVFEASFLDRRSKGKDNFIRVETHRREGSGYKIITKAYNEETGLEASLSIIDDWKDIPPELPIDIDEPLFVYIPNPEANNLNPDSPLGISLFANATDTIEALDYAFDGMRTEMLMGRQRIALPGSVMRKYLDSESGTYKMGFDPTDEAYIRLEGDDADKMKPTDLTGQLRMEQWRMAIQILLDLLAVQVGFDSGYFSFDGKSVKTATEVVSENSHTYKTMMAYRDVLKAAYEHLFRIINKVGALGGIEGAKKDAPSIVFDDGVIEDRNSRATYHEALVTNKLEDRLTAIKAIHGLDDNAAAAMLDRINKENTTITNNSLFGDQA